MNKLIRCISFLLVSYLSITTTLFAQDKPFVVKGTIQDANGKTIALFNIDNKKKEDATVIQNNHFELKGMANGLSVFALALTQNGFPMLIVSSGNDTIYVNSTQQSFPIGEVSGNSQVVSMQEYQKEFDPLITQAQKINTQAASVNESDSSAVASLQQQANDFNNQMESSGIAFVQYHPESLASIFVLMNEIHTMQPQELLNLYNALTDEVKSSRYGKIVQTNIEMMAATAIGAVAPDFTMKNTKGDPVSLSSFRGKYVLVDFWASWCTYCRAENPNVVKAYNEYKNKNFTVLGVSLDNSREGWLIAIRQDDLPFTEVSDLQGWSNAAALLYHVYSIPANFLIDPSGKIIAKNLRGAELEATLKKILN